jgi:hypothetical protein
MFEFVQVTALYSNAVLVAILPQISEFSQKLDLPIPVPITQEHVARFHCDPHKGQVGGWLRLTNEFEFWYSDGYAKGFASPDCYYRLQDLANLTGFHGEVKMSGNEAVQLARDSIRRLGYSETALYADGTPKITKPPVIRSKTVPRYRIQWVEPEDGRTSLDIEIDGEQKRVKSLMISSKSLSRVPPAISVKPQPLLPGESPDFLKVVPPEIETMYHQMIRHSRLNADQQHKLLAAILPIISDYARKLNLSIPIPVTTNHVAKFDTQFFPGETYVWLTNGYEFVYAHGYIYQFRAPYAFFGGTKLDGQIEDYWGEWRMGESDAIKLARETIQNLGYSPKMLHLDKKPSIKKPIIIGEHNIPRYLLSWEFSVPGGEDQEVQPGGIVSTTQIEVDASRKSVKSISIYDANLIRPAPAFDLQPPNALETNRVTPFLYLTNAAAKPPFR